MSGHNVAQELLQAELQVLDPGNGKAIVPDRSGAIVPLVTAAAETRSLPAPVKAGIQLTLVLKTDGGDCVVTASAGVNQTGNTILTFDTEGESVVLLSIPKGNAFVWRVTANDGVALS